MGRIGDSVPPLYFEGRNELKAYIEALEPEIDFLEQRIKEIPDLLDVDRCPEKYLPYLAAKTNCPLVGLDPKYWRRQIRNWPWLLKIKGREDSLIVFLNSIGVGNYEIRTWFRDAGGGYVEEKPEGEPFFNQVDGLWYNIRTHYFSVRITLSDDFLSDADYRWTEDEIMEKLGPWFERAKPFHAELLSFTILPPPLEEHICRWDFCTWDHGVINHYPWEIEWPKEGSFAPGAELGETVILPYFGIYSRGDLWDFEVWDAGRHLDIKDFACLQVIFFESGLWLDYNPKRKWIGKHRWKDGGRWRDRYGSLGGEFIISEFIEEMNFPVVLGDYSDYRPKHRWHGRRNWKCGGTWARSCDRLGGDFLFTANEEE